MIMSNIQEWIIPVLSPVVAIVVAVLSCRWQMRTELRKIRESYASDKKYKAYYDVVNLVFTLLEEGKQHKTVNSDVRFHELLKVKQDLFVYGSDEAFRAFTEYLCSCNLSVERNDIFKPLLDFMLVVRKEISGGKSLITTDDIMLNLMQSRDELCKYKEFQKEGSKAKLNIK